MYTIKALSEISGLSTRTLRYYDEIGLLPPSSYNQAGYRLYQSADIERLQQIMIYKKMQFPLDEIKALLDDAHISIEQTLRNQLNYLQQQKEQIDTQMRLIQKQLGGTEMTQAEKFSQFKNDKLAEVEALYGEELIEKYSTQEIKAQHEHFRHMTESHYQSAQEAEQDLFMHLQHIASNALPVDHPQSKQAFVAHKTWLQLMVPNYSIAYHRQLADLYVDDARFSAYYRQHAGTQAPQHLNEIIHYYTQS